MLKEVLNYTLDKYESVIIVTTKNGATRVIIKADEDEALENEASSPAKPVLSKESLSPERLEIFENLRLLRRGLAEKEKVRPYFIFSDKSLIDMALKLPLTEQEFLEVYGVGENKAKKYGKIFMDELRQMLGVVEED